MQGQYHLARFAGLPVHTHVLTIRSFGYCSAGWCEFQSHLSLLWASVAFLTGSLLLWYEALDKYPVEREDPKA